MTTEHKPGGGYASNKITERPVRTGSGSRSARPAGVAQIGVSWGNHVTRRGESGYSGERLHGGKSFQPTPFGNEVAARTVCGPGGSREVMKTGTQSQHGGVAGNPARPGRGFDERS